MILCLIFDNAITIMFVGCLFNLEMELFLDKIAFPKTKYTPVKFSNQTIDVI